jgi:hypothetical protein
MFFDSLLVFSESKNVFAEFLSQRSFLAQAVSTIRQQDLSLNLDTSFYDDGSINVTRSSLDLL